MEINLIKRLKQGLSKTSNSISTALHSLVSKKKLDTQALEELEEALIIADIGPKTAASIVAQIKKDKFEKDVDISEIKQALAEKIIPILKDCTGDILADTRHTPHVIMVCGVNGNGKTTTISKLGHLLKHHNKKIMFAACDTFRAAAVEQLQIWGNRLDIEVFSGVANQDPASVAFQAMQAAQIRGFDYLIIDTAGRLQNKNNLMAELKKISEVLKKLDATAPHQSLLVLDATTGQNATSQLETFQNIVGINGLIVTKLDGTAKAGIVVQLAQRFHIPIYCIGVGEQAEDLQIFDASTFVNNLLDL